MPALTERDRRTLRLAVLALAIYLGLFYGTRGCTRLEARRAAYQQLLHQAEALRLELERQENRRLRLEKLKAASRIEVSQLASTTLVAQVSAAIQQAAQTAGVGIGSIRELPGSRSGAELAAIQLEAQGPLAGVVTLLDRLETLTFPLLVDSVQIDPDPRGPGVMKLTLRIVILDYDRWQREEDSRHV
jgi:hypothetical protein